MSELMTVAGQTEEMMARLGHHLVRASEQMIPAIRERDADRLNRRRRELEEAARQITTRLALLGEGVVQLKEEEEKDEQRRVERGIQGI